MTETRAVVVQIVEGYVPYLDISRLGGECAQGMLGVDPASAVPDLGDAIDRAKAMEAGWLAWDEQMPTGATA